MGLNILHKDSNGHSKLSWASENNTFYYSVKIMLKLRNHSGQGSEESVTITYLTDSSLLAWGYLRHSPFCRLV